MSRKLVPRPDPGYPYTCTYRRNCTGRPAFDYLVPSLTRWGNVSSRHKFVCPECAEIIRKAYPRTEG